MRTKTLSLIAASIATLSLATTAFAADAAQLATARVRYGDLNLSSDAGVMNLYARLRHAANQVCEYGAFHGVVDQNCAAQAMDGAVAKIDNDRLTALHLHRTGGTRVAAIGR